MPEFDSNSFPADAPERLTAFGRCLADSRALSILVLLRAEGPLTEAEIRFALLLTAYQLRPALAKLRSARLIRAVTRNGGETFDAQSPNEALLDQIFREFGHPDDWAQSLGEATYRVRNMRQKELHAG